MHNFKTCHAGHLPERPGFYFSLLNTSVWMIVTSARTKETFFYYFEAFWLFLSDLYGFLWKIIEFANCVFRLLPLSLLNPLTPELNPSAQRCLTWFLVGILLLEPCISLIYAWKTNKCNNYSFSLLIMSGSSYMFRHYIAIFREHS
jgi:hypothetical protein